MTGFYMTISIDAKGEGEPGEMVTAVATAMKAVLNTRGFLPHKITGGDVSVEDWGFYGEPDTLVSHKEVA